MSRWRRCDQAAPLAAEDLELLAMAAYLLGRDEEQLSALERAHQGYLDRDESLSAVRCAVWLGVHLMLRRELARTAGWFRRAQRLFEQEERDCVEHGYLLLAIDLQHRASGDLEAASAAAGAAAEIGERFGDADLLALALMNQGRYLVRQERVEEGLGKLDEAMVAATAGELSPIVTGLVYCSVIDGLPGGARAAPRQRVDGGLDSVVRPAARLGAVHRHVPRPSRGAHAATRRLGELRWRRHAWRASA